MDLGIAIPGLEPKSGQERMAELRAQSLEVAAAAGADWSHIGASEGALSGVPSSVINSSVRRKGGALPRTGSFGAACKWCAQGECWTPGCSGAGVSTGSSGIWAGAEAAIRMLQQFAGAGPEDFGQGWGRNSKWSATMDKLNIIDAECKVWVGGLSEDVTWKKLEKHFEECCGMKPKITEITSKIKGTACCAFENPDEALSAISTLNGSELDGNAIEVDVWTKTEKKEGEERPQKKPQAERKRQFGNAFSDAMTEVPGSLKVWVGGLPSKITSEQVKAHFVDSGLEADMAKILKEGVACVTFTTEDEKDTAIAAMNGTQLDSKTIVVDAWTAEAKWKKAKV